MARVCRLRVSLELACVVSALTRVSGSGLSSSIGMKWNSLDLAQHNADGDRVKVDSHKRNDPA